MSNTTERFVVGVRLLGEELKTKKRRNKEKAYAIEVILSDESQYTVYRAIKEVASLQARLISRFPVEAGYFSKTERVLPTCPVKQTIFGPSRIVNDDRSFEKLLNSYLKELPSLPASVVKSDLLQAFFALRATDISLPGNNTTTSPKSKKRSPVLSTSSRDITDESEITGPVRCKSYYAVATFSDPKSKFSFTEGAVVQVITKDRTGWWLVDVDGKNGWAPASFLVPMEEDALDDAQESTQTEKVGARYISISSYQASRDDELSFVKGAIVRVMKQCVDGWWLVRYNGGEGFVPGCLFRKLTGRQRTEYAKGIKRKFINRQSTRIIPTVKPNWLHSSELMKGSPNGEGKLPLYQVVEDFKGTEDSKGFPLSKDAVVKVLDKKDHGWWYVEDQHGRQGWAPATFLKLSTGKGAGSGNTVVGTPHTVVQSHTAEREDELTVDQGTTVAVIWAADDGWWMVRNELTQEQGLLPSMCLKRMDEVTGAAQDTAEEQADMEGEQVIMIDFSDDFDEEDGDVALDDCCVATMDFTAASVDELDLYEGQMVTIIDSSDTDYWYVNVDGKEGWVPSNVLDVTTTEEELSTLTYESTTTCGSTSTCGSRRSSCDTWSYTSDEHTDEYEGGSHGVRVHDPSQRNHLCVPEAGRMVNRRMSAETHTGVAQVEQRRRYSTPECWRSEFTHFKREVPPLPPTLIKLGCSASKDEKTSHIHRKLSESDHPQMNGLSEEALRRREGEPPLPTIMVGNNSLGELEKEAAEAERTALEAERRAQALREMVQRRRSWSASACAPDT